MIKAVQGEEESLDLPKERGGERSSTPFRIKVRSIASETHGDLQGGKGVLRKGIRRRAPALHRGGTKGKSGRDQCAGAASGNQFVSAS